MMNWRKYITRNIRLPAIAQPLAQGFPFQILDAATPEMAAM
jgi:hypothetical protein